MKDQYPEELIRIKEILRDAPHGMSVTEIARAIGRNKHSTGRYLDILHASGHVEMRTYGKAKVFSLSSRIPIDTLLGFAHDLIIVLDRDSRVIRINDNFLNLIKKSREEIIGKNISFLPFSDQTAESLLTQVNTILKTGSSGREIKIPGDETSLFYRQKTIPTVFEGGDQGITIILEDITAQKVAQDALVSSEEQFRLMAENIRDGILIKENQNLVYANKRIEEIFGYTRAELRAMPPAHIAAPEERERMEKTIEDFMGAGNVPSDLTFWIIRKDGTRRYIYSRVTSVKHENSLLRYITITDMTEWKKVQDALENQLRLLRHLIEYFPKPGFLSGCSGKNFGLQCILYKNHREKRRGHNRERSIGSDGAGFAGIF